jgi:hypothetical protein
VRLRLSSLTTGERVVLTAGAVLLVVSFLPWFGRSPAQTGWANLPSRLAVLAGAAMVLQVLVWRLAGGGADTTSAAWGLVHLILGLTALALVVVQLLLGDERVISQVSVRLDRRPGIFLGLMAAAGLACGGLLRSRETEAGRFGARLR